MPVKRTIIASGEGLRYEYTAGGAVTPGDLIIVNSSNAAIRHATAGGVAESMFAIENEIFGNGTNTDYATNDRVLAESCHSGMQVNVSIAAAAAAIVIGDQLESAGDGSLRKKAAGTALATAMEAVDNSAGGTKTWCLARIL